MTHPAELRHSDALRQRLEGAADACDTPAADLAEEMLDEALKMRRFPGIEYRDGPAGRRASLKEGPDVWEMVRALRETPGEPEDALLLLAEQCELAPELIRLAAAYYEAHPGEIDARIAADEEAAQRIQETIAQRERQIRA